MPTYPTYKLGDVAEIINGKNQKEVVSSQGDYPIYGSGGIIGWATDYLCKENSTIIGRKGTIDSPIFVNRKFWNVDTAFGIQPSERVLPRYLFFFCKSFDFKKLDKSTTIPSLAKRDLLQISIPLPPLPTQQAIVTRIESLFAELDKAAEHLRTAQQQLKTYRQAVLNHWLNNDDGKWETVKLGEVAEMCLGKMLDKNKNKGTYQPYLRNVNVRWGSFDLDDLLEMRFEESEQDRYGVRKGDLIMCEGGEPGRCAIWNATVPNMKIQKALHRIRVRDSIYNKFVYYLFSLYAQNGRLEKYFTGTTIKHLTGQSLKTIEIPLPPLTEQHRIVKEIESRLSQATTSETYIEKALQQAEALRQSILKKAFSGELV